MCVCARAHVPTRLKLTGEPAGPEMAGSSSRVCPLTLHAGPSPPPHRPGSSPKSKIADRLLSEKVILSQAWCTATCILGRRGLVPAGAMLQAVLGSNQAEGGFAVEQ